jgi:phosphonate ABC transporter permease subunit PhnE
MTSISPQAGQPTVLMFSPIIQAAGQGPTPEGSLARNSILPNLKLRLPRDLIRAEVQFEPTFLASMIREPFETRRFSDSIRGIDTLIWALIWINVVGLGPFAGVLAIMTSDIGSFTKLYSEAIEAVDRKPAEGVVSTGGSGSHAVRFGIIPTVLPVLISQTLYYFESNTRSATIIGIVGAGGIGLYLSEMIRTYEWDRVAFIILMVLATVALIDFISTKLRLALVGERNATH